MIKWISSCNVFVLIENFFKKHLQKSNVCVMIIKNQTKSCQNKGLRGC